MKVTIIGAGIGGLTTAIALKKQGIDCEIFEATSAFRKVGAGIIIAINSMQIFERLGLVPKIQAAGVVLDNMQITNAQLKPISEMDATLLKDLFKYKSVGIHRATLHDILLAELPNTPLHLDKKLKHLNQKNGKIFLEFEDGTQHETDVLIGADGIHSAVRKTIFPSTKERYAKQICWRGVCDFDLGNFSKIGRECWGVKERFGIIPIAPNTVYWFACANYKNDWKKEFQGVSIQDVFAKFNPLVGNIIAATNPDKIITAELTDLELLPTWHQGNVVLMGDAAHATTPNMGQGANQAIESAWVLADSLQKEKNVQKAFANYQVIRQKKAHQIIKTSWQIGKIAHVSNPIFAGLRNGLFRMMPSSIAMKQMKELLTLDYLD